MSKKLNIPLGETKALIKSFGGFQIKAVGKIVVELENRKCKEQDVFEVVDYEGLLILGYRKCKTMKYEINDIEKLENNKE